MSMMYDQGRTSSMMVSQNSPGPLLLEGAADILNNNDDTESMFSKGNAYILVDLTFN